MSETRKITEIIKNDIIPSIKGTPIDLLVFKNKISRISYLEKMDYVRTHLNDEEIIKKIKTHIINTGADFTIEDLQYEITNNDYVCSHFIKDTGRQNVYEHLQFNILKYIFKKSIISLPSGGKNCKYVYNSMISNVKPPTVKSIDFEEVYDDLTIYYFSKYTKDVNGGAQDNQGADAINFIIEANKYVINNNDNNRFVLLGDGDYYQTLHFKNTVRDYLNDKVKVHTINTILSETW